MNEKLICSSCNAKINTSALNCEYCGNNYRLYGKSSELLATREKLDKMLVVSEPDEIVNFINTLDHKNHPIISYRLAKAEMLICLYEECYIISQKFCDIIHIVDLISIDTPEYRKQFINFISDHLPVLSTRLYLEDYQNILSFLREQMFDKDRELAKKLTEQLLISELGAKFMKEYLFYIDEKNFINDSAFLKKKEYLEAKYKNYKNELTKNNHSS
jgi:ribosomal protein L40E